MTQPAFYLALLSFVSIVAGALARRHWGGWGHSIKWHRGLGFLALGVLIAVAALSCTLPEGFGHRALIFGFFAGIIPQLSIWFVQGHGWAQAMGMWPERPLGVCVAVFLGNYGAALALQGFVLSLDGIDDGHDILTVMGLLTPLPHYLCQRVDFGKLLGWEMKPADMGHFYDGRTVFGELGLGAIMFGALPIACLIEVLLRGV